MGTESYTSPDSVVGMIVCISVVEVQCFCAFCDEILDMFVNQRNHGTLSAEPPCDKLRMCCEHWIW